MPEQYFTLMQRIDGRWSPEFGDYELEVVEDEMMDMLSSCDLDGNDIKRGDLKIVSHSDDVPQIEVAERMNKE